MSYDPTPTEAYDKSITVIEIDRTSIERTDVTSFDEAISTVKARSNQDTVLKIEDQDEEVVFTSEEMEISDWERVWRQEKRRLSVETEVRECPYDTVGCGADDLCLECQLDEAQSSLD